MTNEADYVRKSIFNVHMQRIDQRFEALEKLMDSRVERMEALADRNLAKHEVIAERIEKRFDTVTARLDTLESRFTWNLAWVGIIIGIVLAIVQRLWKIGGNLR